VLDAATGLPSASFPIEKRRIEWVRLAPDGRHIAVGSAFHITVWRVSDGELVIELKVGQKSASSLAYAVMGAEMARRDLTDEALLDEFIGNAGFFSRDGREFFVCGRTRVHFRFTRRWRLDDYTEMSLSPCYHDRGFQLSMDGRHAVYPDAGGLIIRDISTGEEVAYWPDTEIDGYAVRDEGRIAVLGPSDRITVLELVENI
jgi:hypothetical protein